MLPMKLSSFNYHLPEELIAHRPAHPRDRSRLLVLKKSNGTITHTHFFDIGRFLKKGDMIVLNNSKVFPARLYGTKENGGKTEILLVRPFAKRAGAFEWNDHWYIIGKRLRAGQRVVFSKKLAGDVTLSTGRDWVIRFTIKGTQLQREIERIGTTPTPPYIKSTLKGTSLTRAYQTVYAQPTGSVAAPTAGFHFTQRLIAQLKRKGVSFQFVTLHVGPGTFRPIDTQRIEDFSMLPEWAELDVKTARALNKAKQEGKRIITVGTTATRTIESFVHEKKLKPGKQFVNIFIHPGYQFRFVDALITNFHLPKSTPLLLVSAFAGKKHVFKAYRDAITKRYRLYSFGDAMFIE